MNLSIHTAPIKQTHRPCLFCQCTKRYGFFSESCSRNLLARILWPFSRLYFLIAQATNATVSGRLIGMPQQWPQLGLIERLEGGFVKTVLEEPQDLAAHLGGVAEYRGAPVWAIGPVGRRGLAPVLLAQCFLVLDSVLTHPVASNRANLAAILGGDERRQSDDNQRSGHSERGALRLVVGQSGR
ncbi:hypothetical protein [Candidatus Accumulibacter sp. ACC012]|uniref:hypothetical protein n=1 Tax=Candidatus Accumulibacter sp. ACC012 TaxID=2823332 RepID=UPI0025C2B666|nr:hypothetical protein [Candidatus Accumulibacter sp. ACC012]